MRRLRAECSLRYARRTHSFERCGSDPIDVHVFLMRVVLALRIVVWRKRLCSCRMSYDGLVVGVPGLARAVIQIFEERELLSEHFKPDCV